MKRLLLSLLLLSAAFLSACATTSTGRFAVVRPLPKESMQECPEKIPAELIIGDPYDLARALNLSVYAYRKCAAIHRGLVDAAQEREQAAEVIEGVRR